MKKIAKNKKEPVRYLFVSELLIPFLMLFVLAGINLFIGIYVSAYSVIFMHTVSFLVAVGLGLFAYLKISPFIDNIYFEEFKWKKPVFYILYYIIYIIEYAIAYSVFMLMISKDNQEIPLLMTEFGAALSFGFKTYTMYVFIQILAKILRAGFINISKVISKKLDENKKIKETEDGQ